MKFDPIAPLRLTRQGDRIVVRLPSCRLHDDDADLLATRFFALAEGRPERHLILDLSRVESAGGASLGAFVGLHRRLTATGCRLTLTGLRPLVRDVFAVTRLDTLLNIDPVPPWPQNLSA